MARAPAELDTLFAKSCEADGAPRWEMCMQHMTAEEFCRRASRTEEIDIVFDGPPGPEGPHFVEVEDASGRSIRVGEWVQRSDGYWTLRIKVPHRGD